MQESAESAGDKVNQDKDVQVELAMPEENHEGDRKILLKMDLVIVPMVALIYLMSFLDRGNIGNARVAGLQTDLRLTDNQYQTAITITYVPYILAELPSNLTLRKIGPRILLPSLCVVWGIVTTLQCLINGYGGLLASRFFLGLAEGGVFPGIVLYLSLFYRRHELQLRIAVFYASAALSGAFSGLLAAAIVQMDGVGGLSGWRWIFCLEGMLSVIVGVVAFFVLPNNPGEVAGFTPEQIRRCEERLRLDVHLQSTERFSSKAVLSTLGSLHVWLHVLMLFCSGVCLFGLAYFTPSIVNGFGYSTTKTQLLTVPPFVSAFIVTLVMAYVSDRYRQRGIAAMVTWAIAIIGVCIFYKGRSMAVRYTSLFLMITGVYATAPSLISWVPNNTAAHTRRATAIAMAFISTNTGGIVSTWIFPTTQAPYYPFASKFILSLSVIAFVLASLTILLYRHLNAQKDDPEYRRRVLEPLDGMELPQQLEALGDVHPDFRYTS
ncbi:hypothetical protein N7517_000400 [Penicillium concentricum]|uniref:Major facilitator superfamily (MFS) profile domain-containing protein n=1 Tax=Penicillium concentricum TaxID=293559 RepID=A0A9W9SS43_9EURO|nr:uncharacterized protein N7517_000400 [Penicillium concentricum]KAJ5382489.1 hypothetical protein N7517_000400 [Penicillium concentricum]